MLSGYWSPGQWGGCRLFPGGESPHCGFGSQTRNTPSPLNSNPFLEVLIQIPSLRQHLNPVQRPQTTYHHFDSIIIHLPDSNQYLNIQTAFKSNLETLDGISSLNQHLNPFLETLADIPSLRPHFIPILGTLTNIFQFFGVTKITSHISFKFMFRWSAYQKSSLAVEEMLQ